MIPVDERVGFGQRLFASLIDSVIFMALSIALGVVAGGFLGGLFAGASASAAMGMVGAMAGFFVAMTIVGILYPLIEGIKGWSPGKRVLGMQIGAAGGEIAAPKTLLTRYALKNSPTILSFVSIVTGIALLGTVASLLAVVVTIGCFMVLMAGRQALHDRIAGTAVFKADALHEAAAMEAIHDAMAEARPAERAEATADAESASAVTEAPDDAVDEQPAAPAPMSQPVAPAPRPRSATTVVPGQTRQCPKCGQYDTVLGTVIGWYCRICGWRESRG